jgi:hypothetical protein
VASQSISAAVMQSLQQEPRRSSGHVFALPRGRESILSSGSSNTDGNTETVTITAKIHESSKTKRRSSDDTDVIVSTRAMKRPRADVEANSPEIEFNVKKSCEMKPASQVVEFSSSSASRPLRKRVPLQTLPPTLQDQIQNKASSLESMSSSSRARRWMKKDSPVKEDMRSVLERRIGLIR